MEMSLGGLTFGYDSGSISDFLIMEDFLLNFANCTNDLDPTSCTFSNSRTGLIVGMLSIGSLVSAIL